MTLLLTLSVLLASIGVTAHAWPRDPGPSTWRSFICTNIAPSTTSVKQFRLSNGSRSELQCGTQAWGFTHIDQRHGGRWDRELTAFGFTVPNRSWTWLMDWATAVTLRQPEVLQTDGYQACYSRTFWARLPPNGAIETRTVRVIHRFQTQTVSSSYVSDEGHCRIGLNNNEPPATPTNPLPEPGFPYCGLPNGGCYQHLTNSVSAYFSPQHGTQVVQGRIRNKWSSMGWENSSLGYPASWEFCGLRDGGCGQHFERENGSIYWVSSVDANFIRGSIFDRWAAAGWENSIIGYPRTDEFCGLYAGGCGQHFTHENGSIYWTGHTGAHIVRGLIRGEWASKGWEQSPYGYPVTSEYPSAGGVIQDFEYGYIYWSPSSGIVGSWRSTALTAASQEDSRNPPSAITPTPTPSAGEITPALTPDMRSRTASPVPNTDSKNSSTGADPVEDSSATDESLTTTGPIPDQLRKVHAEQARRIYE